MRCLYCRSNNPTGVTICQVCGAWLIRVCPQCSSENPTGSLYCNQCGQSLFPLIEARIPQARQNQRSSSPPPLPISLVSLVGFGAIVAVASAAFPWYWVTGTTSTPEVSASISYQLSAGWAWFPGIPILLVILSSVLASFLAIQAGRGRPHPAASILLGLVSLFGASWLWYGFRVPGSTGGFGSVETGPILILIGAIVVVVGGALIAQQWNQLRQTKTDRNR